MQLVVVYNQELGVAPESYGMALCSAGSTFACGFSRIWGGTTSTSFMHANYTVSGSMWAQGILRAFGAPPKQGPQGSGVGDRREGNDLAVADERVGPGPQQQQDRFQLCHRRGARLRVSNVDGLLYGGAALVAAGVAGKSALVDLCARTVSGNNNKTPSVTACVDLQLGDTCVLVVHILPRASLCWRQHCHQMLQQLWAWYQGL